MTKFSKNLKILRILRFFGGLLKLKTPMEIPAKLGENFLKIFTKRKLPLPEKSGACGATAAYADQGYPNTFGRRSFPEGPKVLG